MELQDDGYCFACGKNNPQGLRLTFTPCAEGVETTFTPAREHQGWTGVVHGGIISTLLDEVMANRAIQEGRWAVTARFQVRYLAPARVGDTLRVVGKLDEAKGRMLQLSARLEGSDGTLLAEGKSTFVVPESSGA